MCLIEIAPHASKEEKLNQILNYLEELKNAFSEVVQEFEDEGAEEIRPQSSETCSSVLQEIIQDTQTDNTETLGNAMFPRVFLIFLPSSSLVFQITSPTSTAIPRERNSL